MIIMYLIGYFLLTSTISGVAYMIAWPLETLKNLSQGGKPFQNATIADRIQYLGGLRGLYRGVWPGTICGAFRNGCAMISMIYAQRWATKLGLRD